MFTTRPWTVLFIILLEVINKEHGLLTVREAIKIHVTLNVQYCIDPRHCPLELILGSLEKPLGFFGQSVQSMPFLEKTPVSKYAGHFRSHCGWAHIQELRTSSHRTFSFVSGHSTVQIK